MGPRRGLILGAENEEARLGAQGMRNKMQVLICTREWHLDASGKCDGLEESRGPGWRAWPGSTEYHRLSGQLYQVLHIYGSISLHGYLACGSGMSSLCVEAEDRAGWKGSIVDVWVCLCGNIEGPEGKKEVEERQHELLE